MLRFLGLITVLFAAIGGAQASTLLENFDDVNGLASTGWRQINRSSPQGVTGWFQGNPAVFQSQSGAPDAYAAANFLNAGPAGNISNWLITPLVRIGEGSTLTFFTRTEAAGLPPDRLELRVSRRGVDVGTSDNSVGDFSELLLAVNPALTSAGYPDTWTSFSYTWTGVAAPFSAHYAFRYFVPDTGVNANYIGIDSVSSNSVVLPEPSTAVCFLIGAAVLGWLRGRRMNQEMR